MDFGNEEEYLIVRVNGGKMKNSEELRVDMSEGITLKYVIKESCKKFGSKEQYKMAKIFNKNGVLIFESDFNLIASGDILYIALKGEEFNFCAILDDYELGRTLGVGGFGKVILGKHRETREEVAIKFTDVGDQLSSAHLVQSIYKEAESLKSLQHKNIVKQYHAFIEGKQFIMIMEAAMGGELYEYLKKHDTMPEPRVREIILQVVQAMLYCHSRGVVHRDLKLENVLFTNKYEDDFRVKVVDFGIAGMSQDKVDAGTLAYMAPECLEKVAADTTPAIDVWAIGIMFYAMIYGSLPFHAPNERDLVKQIRTDAVKFPKGTPLTNEGKDVIKKMLQKDPKKRLELIDFVQTPYNTMEDEEFDKIFDETKQQFQSQKEKAEEEEEQKLQENFIKSLDLKSEEKHHKNPHRERSTGKAVKKKSKK